MNRRVASPLLLLTATYSAACSREPPAQSQSPSTISAVAPVTPSLKEQTAPGHKPPAGFEYPSDLGGKALAKAVAPDRPAVPPIATTGDGPKPCSIPPQLLEPDLTGRPLLTPPPLVELTPIGAQPPPPAERVPADLGSGAGTVPDKPKLPVAPGITARSRDVEIPPELPMLGRPLADRVGFDDPTADLGNALIVAPRIQLPVGPSPFVKVGVPDPFELAEQIKPKVPASAEPGLTPVPVNPRRVK